MALLNLSTKNPRIGRALQFLAVIVTLLMERDVTRSCKQRPCTHIQHSFTVRNKKQSKETL